MLVRDRSRRRRRGATMVEAAIVLPAVFMFTLGLIVIGLGVFRYQQVAALAREGARWASVHGNSYARDTGNTAADAAAVYNNAIKPMAAGLDTSKINYSVTWPNGKSPVYLADPANNKYLNAYVTVTVSYSWTPEAYLSPTTLSSTSKMPINY
jgi:Flp pilus assembly protein TadG